MGRLILRTDGQDARNGPQALIVGMPETNMSKPFLLFSLSLATAFAADQTWTGQISESMCGADHSSMAKQGKKVDPHECALICVKGGGKFVFASDGKVFDIANQNFSELSEHAGHTVKLMGDLDSDGKAITVSHIEMTQ